MKTLNRILTLLIFFLISSCGKWVEVGPPTDSLAGEHLFADDASAKSVLNGIYTQLGKVGFANGSSASISILTGCSADEFELSGASVVDKNIPAFQENALYNETPGVTSLWNSLYQIAFYANTALEGLVGSNKLSKSLQEQLIGEAIFIRAFCHFYLVNLFGDVPVVLSSDYRINNTLTRTKVEDVYKQVVLDLEKAKSLLSIDYSHSNGERVRPNRSTAQALLSRVFLYTEAWDKAAEEADEVIKKNDLYSLVSLNTIFLKNSKEAILQLIPFNEYTYEGWAYSPPTSGFPRYVKLNKDLLDLMRPADNRSQWVGSGSYQGFDFLYPFKYKVMDKSKPYSEYSMVMRLAEQYLIRAEALAHQEKLADALVYLNVIRERAGLAKLIDINQQELLSEIADERFRELFSEWGHRWLDLKRTGKVDAVLKERKPQWSSYQILYPIPKIEIDRNKNLLPNLGYTNY